ncbi:NAD(P)H-binding protein [Streptomyces sp. Li-HN-5-11]|uniref:NAD(P)H-binding protein n=1 Tax=Streptomyces sp. Li-HN-5-11 TaxID=3075432 RepID=UPI0028A814E1|nr:NAD(P)H-binding protein [Streptomyces sp. Li-HN-5-11]WNM31349.1 NAD(P)H-binding protein [Streptomyces sp. Li-HN-5-11]
MTILVTGATGNVGRRVVDLLLRAGEPVRALTRDPAAAGLPSAVAVVQGDLTKPETLTPAVEGVERIYLFPVPDTVSEVVEMARRSGVRRVVVLSSDAVTDGTDSGLHLRVERAVEESGLEWTHVRPGEFALNKVSMWAGSIRSEGVVRMAYGAVRGVPVHEEDVAAVAVAALTQHGHAGRAYSVSGPEALTQRDQVALISAAIGRDIRFEEITPQEWRAELVGRGMPAYAADYILGFHARWALRPPVVSEDVQRVLGRPARTFARWAAEHAPAFR